MYKTHIQNITRIAAFALLFFSVAHAQNELDAFRFSGNQLMGTARVQGVGGAFSAVGADYSSAYLNPAGLGLYRRSEFQFTPHFRSNGTASDYIGFENASKRVNIGIGSVGYVHQSERDGDAALKSFSFGIGFNQIANFHRNTDVTAYNGQSSITDFFAQQANGTDVNQLLDENSYQALAYYAYMIDTSNQSTTDYVAAAQGGDILQRYRTAETGRINEWAISFAGNIQNKLFLGATVGIQSLTYRQELEFVEEDADNVHNSWDNDSIPFDYMILDDAYATRGSGINLRVGLIYRPTDFLRLGISAQTPTVASMRDAYETEITGALDNEPNLQGIDAVEGVYTYSLKTPFKVTTGAMLLIGKLGFITGDFEFTDYTTSSFSADVNQTSPFYYSFNDENAAIRNRFDFAYNYRLGAEVRSGPFRFRGGYANYGAVLNENYTVKTNFEDGSQENYSGKKQYYTTGFGYKTESFYLDLAFVRGVSQDNITVYSFAGASGIAPELHRKNSSNNFILTTGFTF